MNKLFNKLRKNRGLSMFLALAMLISLLPFNTVLAHTATDGNATEYGMRTVSPTDAISTVSEDPEAPTVTFRKVDAGYTADTSSSDCICKVSYTETQSWKAVKIKVENHDVTAYDKVEIKYTPSRNGMTLEVQAEYPSGNAKLGNSVVYEGETLEQQTFTADVTENVSQLFFFIDTDGHTYSGEEVTASIDSITFIRATGGTTPENPGSGENPEGGTTPDPAIVPTATVVESTGYTVVNNDDGSVTVTYDAATVGWNMLNISVSNCNKAVYSKVRFEVTPESDMVLCITDAAGSHPYYRDHTTLLAAGGKATLEYDLVNDETGFRFYCDANGGTGTKTFTIHSIEFINPNAPAEPEVEEIAATLSIESGNPDFVIDEQGKAYSANGGKFRGVIAFPASFKEVEVGKVLTINYKTDISNPELGVEFAYDSSGNGKPSGEYGTFYTAKESLEIPITEELVAFFAASPTEAEFSDSTSTRIRLKTYTAPVGSSFELISVTYGNPVTEEPDDGEEGGETEVEPTVTYASASSSYTKVETSDPSDLVAVSYTNVEQYSTVNFTVQNHDYTKLSRMNIKITPSKDCMQFCVANNWDPIYSWTELDAGTQVVSVDLSKNIETLRIYLDSKVDTTSDKELTAVIHSIEFVDPNALPTSKAKFTDFSGTEEDPNKNRTDINFTKNEANGIAEFSYNAGYTLRLYANFTGYEYNAGDVLVVYSDEIAEFAGEVYIGYPTDQSIEYLNGVEGEGMVYYVLPETTKTNVPTQIRWKGTLPGTGASIKGMYIWDAATFNEINAQKYDPNQVPQGLAVTYYDDIYSRGVAWNTDDTVPSSTLYYIKSDGTMTADTVDWDSTDVKKVVATKKAYTAKTNDGKTSKVWHTFKAVVKDLEPGATYFYRAGSEEYGWSKVGTFNVEKAVEDIDSLHFIYVTDTQEEQQASFKKYAKLVADAYSRMPNAAYLAHTGDLVNRGESEDEMHMEEWMYVLDEPKEQLMNSVLMPTVGNHDCGSFVFTDRFAIDWADYKEDSTDDLKTGGCYTFTYGKPENGVFVISLNTNDGWTDFTPLRTWMEEQLKAHNDYKWKIVQMHAGAMTAGDHAMDGESKALRKDFSPLFAKYKVDLVLQGHDHVYTRTRSMYYGDNPFEEGTQYYDGHTPVYLSAVKETRTVNGKSKEVYIEPQGTHYITINASGGKTYPEEPAEALDPVIVESEGENPINPKDEDGNFGSIAQPGKPMYALISIEGDLLNFEAYTYSSSGSELYDTFAVDKSSDRGYTLDTINDGKTEVQLYGIKVEGKKYDGHPVKLDLTGFNCSEPSIMDTASLKYNITTVSGGVDPVTKEQYVFHPSNLIYGMMPKEPGTYHMTISVPKTNKYFYGEVAFDFTITE